MSELKGILGLSVYYFITEKKTRVPRSQSVHIAEMGEDCWGGRPSCS